MAAPLELDDIRRTPKDLMSLLTVAGDAANDAASPNRNLAPLSTSLDAAGRLCVGGRALSSLAAEFGTPLYVMDEASLRRSMQQYRQSLLEHYPGESLAIFASKAHSTLALAALVAAEGLGWDAVSEGELLTGLQGGVPPARMVLHGNNKSRAELALALAHGVMIVLDNWSDVCLLEQLLTEREELRQKEKRGGAHDETPKQRVMLRFTPGIECHTHEYIRTGHSDSKFGFGPDQLEAALRHLSPRLNADSVLARTALVAGLHCHIGSQIFELQPHTDLAGVIADAMILARSLGHAHCTDFNVGGGLGVKYTPHDNPPSIQEWVANAARAVLAACTARGLVAPLPRLLCEPGRSLVATAGVTLYTLGARKEIPASVASIAGAGASASSTSPTAARVYISIDGGMSDNPRPITYRAAYTAVLADRPILQSDENGGSDHASSAAAAAAAVAVPMATVTVAGKHCESGDVLLPRVSLPADAGAGDILAVFVTGAYNYSMSSNYNRIPRPAMVIVPTDAAARVEVCLRRETPQELLRNDVVPSWLRPSGV